MCGIAGQIWEPGQRADRMVEVYRDMQNVLSRRGPDQNGMHIDENAALIHARLCVVDPENGLQPMGLCFGEEDYTLVYNGELYNTDELRDDLKILGHKFGTHLHAEHHLVLLDTPELVQALYRAVDARDLPGMADVDSSLLCSRS